MQRDFLSMPQTDTLNPFPNTSHFSTVHPSSSRSTIEDAFLLFLIAVYVPFDTSIIYMVPFYSHQLHSLPTSFSTAINFPSGDHDKKSVYPKSLIVNIESIFHPISNRIPSLSIFQIFTISLSNVQAIMSAATGFHFT